MKKQNVLGYNFYDMEELLIPYPVTMLDMRLAQNNSYMLLLTAYIRLNGNLFGVVTLNLNHLLAQTGFKINTRSKIHYDSYKEALKNMIDCNYISVEQDIDSLRPKELFEIKLNKENNMYMCDDKFVTITASEFNIVISNAELHGAKPGTLLNLYLLMKKISMSDYESRLIFPTKNTLKKYLCISSADTLSKYFNILIELKLVYKDKPHYIQNKKCKGTYVRTRNVYALNPKNFAKSKERLSKFYEEEVYDFSEIDPTKIAINEA